MNVNWGKISYEKKDKSARHSKRPRTHKLWKLMQQLKLHRKTSRNISCQLLLLIHYTFVFRINIATSEIIRGKKNIALRICSFALRYKRVSNKHPLVGVASAKVLEFLPFTVYVFSSLWKDLHFVVFLLLFCKIPLVTPWAPRK